MASDIVCYFHNALQYSEHRLFKFQITHEFTLSNKENGNLIPPRLLFKDAYNLINVGPWIGN